MDFRSFCRFYCPPDGGCLARQVLRSGRWEHPQIRIAGRLNMPALEHHCEPWKKRTSKG